MTQTMAETTKFAAMASQKSTGDDSRLSPTGPEFDLGTSRRAVSPVAKPSTSAAVAKRPRRRRAQPRSDSSRHHGRGAKVSIEVEREKSDTGVCEA